MCFFKRKERICQWLKSIGPPRPLQDKGFHHVDPTSWVGSSFPVKLPLKPWRWQNQEQLSAWEQDSI